MGKTKEILYNFIKNMMAYAIPVAILQFLVQPLIARQLGEEKNGLFLTIAALNYFITAITASVLLHTRLLQNEKYEKENLTGDYNPILLAMAFINALIMLIASRIYMGNTATILDIALCVVISLLFLVHDYICVQYRMELNYTKILMSNVVLCVGYVIGCMVYLWLVPYWQIVFIVAYLLCEVYDITHTTCLREPLRRTPLFGDTLKRYFIIAGASVLSHLIAYGDRLLLYPVSNGSTVSVFTSAEIMGKMLMLIASPLSAFLLSYLVKENTFKLKLNKKLALIFLGFFAAAYGICYLLSIPMLNLLYPVWAERAMVYVPLTTLTSLVNLIIAVSNIFIIRFAKSKWQLVINGSYLVVYLLLSFLLLSLYGLMGFCIGNLIAAVFKLMVIFLVGKFAIPKAAVPAEQAQSVTSE